MPSFQVQRTTVPAVTLRNRCLPTSGVSSVPVWSWPSFPAVAWAAAAAGPGLAAVAAPWPSSLSFSLSFFSVSCMGLRGLRLRLLLARGLGGAAAAAAPPAAATTAATGETARAAARAAGLAAGLAAGADTLLALLRVTAAVGGAGVRVTAAVGGGGVLPLRRGSRPANLALVRTVAVAAPFFLASPLAPFFLASPLTVLLPPLGLRARLTAASVLLTAAGATALGGALTALAGRGRFFFFGLFCKAS